jgi:hypothetical protein
LLFSTLFYDSAEPDPLPTQFQTQLSGYTLKASVVPIKYCHVGKYRPFSSQISPDPRTRRISTSTQNRKPARIYTGHTTPHTAQLSKHSSHHNEAFIQLARS